ncbi:MAG: DUF2339 domain-containing protein [Candidatus Doudnabacteria bacterium]|nr:DUF2339 domain-containing protein [Candidatus Doudnabacteria bacterium]
MTILLVLIGLVCFFYLVSKLNSIEGRLNKIEKGERLQSSVPERIAETPTVSTSNTPIPQAPSFTPELEMNTAPSQGLEFQFGGKFFTVIGSIAVLLGIGFFLRYAFEQNLITETMRVVMGTIAGVILMALGNYLRSKYQQYGNILQGTGVGVLYLTFYSAYSYYELITQPVALILMLAVTILTIILSLRSSSQALAGVALLGAYLTPFMSNMLETGVHPLFIYILLVNVGALTLALLKGWRSVTLGGLLGTAIVYVSWHSASYNSSLWTVCIFYLTLFFLTFLTANIYRYFIQRHRSDENDLALVIFNPMFYFIAGAAVLQALNPDYAGWFAFVLSAIYFGLGYAIPEDNSDAKIFHYGVCTTLFFIGVPLAFEKQWVTIAWAAQGIFMLWYAMKKSWRGLEFLAHVILMIASLRFLITDLGNVQGEYWIFNGRALTFALLASFLAYGAYTSYKSKSAMAVDSSIVPNNRTDRGFEVLMIQIQILAMFWTGAEIIEFGNQHFIGLVWSILGMFMLLIGLNVKSWEVRTIAYVTAFIAAFRVVTFDSELRELALVTPILNLRVLAFVGAAVVFGFIFLTLNNKKHELTKEEARLVPVSFFIVTNLMLLWVLSLEIIDYFDKRISDSSINLINGLENSKRVSLSVAWSLYAALLLVLGIARKSTSARLMSIGLFAVVIFKVFLYDTSNLPDLYRFVSFLSLGIVLLAVSYMYNRYKARIEEFIKAN